MATTPDPIGRLRTKVEVQHDVGTGKTAGGAHVAEWQTLCTPRVELRPLSAREVLTGAQMQAAVTHLITLRYRGDLPLTADMRAKKGTRIFHFAEPPRNTGEGREWWEVLAIEVVSNPRG